MTQTIENEGLQKVYDRLCRNAYMSGIGGTVVCRYCGGSANINVDPVTRFAGANVPHQDDCPLRIAERELGVGS